ncbi:MAG: endonuclease domain-containing protein [Chloroflexota bacterium]|nr:MAG: cytosine methyltransferase [Chloroflexota bacterium]
MSDKPDNFTPDRISSRLSLNEQKRKSVLERAREFRRSPTRSEGLLWQQLRGRRLGVKFRRQHPIGPLVVDFCCPELALIIEVDGPVHEQQEARDAARQTLLEDRGYRVLRLTAAAVERDLAAAVERITVTVRDDRRKNPTSHSGHAEG